MTSVPPHAETATWKGVTASVVLHLAIGGALFGTFAGGEPVRPPTPPAMAVELAPVSSAPPAPPEQVAPGERQVQTEEAAEQVPEQVDLPPIPVIRAPDAAVVVASKPKAPPQPAADTETERKRVEQTTAPAALPLPPSKAAGAPVQGTPTAGDAVAQQTWEGKVLARLERKKRYPRESLQAGEEDTVFVKISVDRSGHVVGSTVIKSRNFARLNEAALDQVRRSDPLPAPPTSVAGSVVSFVVPLRFFVTSGGR